MEISLENLTIRYRRRLALDSVNLRFGPGITGLLGPNGAGKSTLIQAVATMLRPTSGRICIDAMNIRGRKGRRAARSVLGYLPQGVRLPSSLTAEEVVAYSAWLSRVPARNANTAITEALASVNMQQRRGDRVGTLSGGMQRRIALAAAIVHSPTILLLDEPTVGLDPRQRAKFRDTVVSLKTKNVTVIVSTHLVGDLSRLADRVAVIDDGSVTFDGTLSAMIEIGHGDNDDDRLETAFEALTGEAVT